MGMEVGVGVETSSPIITLLTETGGVQTQSECVCVHVLCMCV